jgi:hypothetical protein
MKSSRPTGGSDLAVASGDEPGLQPQATSMRVQRSPDFEQGVVNLQRQKETFRNSEVTGESRVEANIGWPSAGDSELGPPRCGRRIFLQGKASPQADSRINQQS